MIILQILRNTSPPCAINCLLLPIKYTDIIIPIKEETETTLRRRKYKKLERMADGISIISTLVLAIFLIYLLFAMVIDY